MIRKINVGLFGTARASRACRPGSVVPESLLAARGAVLRALSADCEAERGSFRRPRAAEVYRIWIHDLLQAAFISRDAADWFYQLRVLEQEADDEKGSRRWKFSGF